MQMPLRQKGAVLVVSLIMLIVLTLLAVSAINMSTVNLKIVGNMQAQMGAENATQTGIDAMLSNLVNFTTVSPAVPPDSGNKSIHGYTVTVSAPQCIWTGKSKGWEESYDPSGDVISRWDSDWIVTADVTSGAISGEYTQVTQGVRVLQMTAPCP